MGCTHGKNFLHGFLNPFTLLRRQLGKWKRVVDEAVVEPVIALYSTADTPLPQREHLRLEDSEEHEVCILNVRPAVVHDGAFVG